MSIAVIGAGGQLGQDLCPLLDPDVFRITRKDVDVTDYTGLEKVLTECSPDIVINLSACNLVGKQTGYILTKSMKAPVRSAFMVSVN